MAGSIQCENLLTTWTSFKIPFALPLISNSNFATPTSSMVQKQQQGGGERYPNDFLRRTAEFSLFNPESQGWIVENQGCFCGIFSVRDPFKLVARDARAWSDAKSLYVVVLV